MRKGSVESCPIDFRATLLSILPQSIPNVPDRAISLMERHACLLLEEGRVTNLTRILDPREMIERHFAESLLGLPWTVDGGVLLDLGSGAGFPGLPLQIARESLWGSGFVRRGGELVSETRSMGDQGVRIGDTSSEGSESTDRVSPTLLSIDSVGKKVRFVNRVIKELSLRAVAKQQFIRKAADLVDLGPASSICMRAVPSPASKVRWLPNALVSGGYALLFLGEDGLRSSILEATKLGLRIEAVVDIPGRVASHLLVICNSEVR